MLSLYVNCLSTTQRCVVPHHKRRYLLAFLQMDFQYDEDVLDLFDGVYYSLLGSPNRLFDEVVSTDDLFPSPPRRVLPPSTSVQRQDPKPVVPEASGSRSNPPSNGSRSNEAVIEPKVNQGASGSRGHQPTNESTVNSAAQTATTTPHTSTVPAEPAYINGRTLASLERLRASTTIKDVEMRKNNSHQRFVTREGVSIYLTQEILQRIDFRAIQAKRGYTKTINLPDRYQVRLRVRADGKILFQKYHKRGIAKKLQSLLNRTVQREGEC